MKILVLGALLLSAVSLFAQTHKKPSGTPGEIKESLMAIERKIGQARDHLLDAHQRHVDARPCDRSEPDREAAFVDACTFVALIRLGWFAEAACDPGSSPTRMVPSPGVRPDAVNAATRCFRSTKISLRVALPSSVIAPTPDSLTPVPARAAPAHR